MSLVERIDAYGGPAVRWPPYPMGRNVYPLGLRSQAHNARLLRIRLGRHAVKRAVRIVLVERCPDDVLRRSSR